MDKDFQGHVIWGWTQDHQTLFTGSQDHRITGSQDQINTPSVSILFKWNWFKKKLQSKEKFNINQEKCYSTPRFELKLNKQLVKFDKFDLALTFYLKVWLNIWHLCLYFDSIGVIMEQITRTTFRRFSTALISQVNEGYISYKCYRLINLMI